MYLVLLIELNNDFFFLFVFFLGYLFEKNVKLIENLVFLDVGFFDSFWEQFFLYEGCFELNEMLVIERNDFQNNNYVCNDFCKNDGKNYFVIIGE